MRGQVVKQAGSRVCDDELSNLQQDVVKPITIREFIAKEGERCWFGKNGVCAL